MTTKSDKSESFQAAAKVFVEALRTQCFKVRRMVIMEILEDEKLREDVEAALLWEERRDDPKRPFREYLAEYEAEQR